MSVPTTNLVYSAALGQHGECPQLWQHVAVYERGGMYGYHCYMSDTASDEPAECEDRSEFVFATAKEAEYAGEVRLHDLFSGD